MSLTNLKTLSHDRIAKILRGFLLGKITFQTLQVSLKGLITFDFTLAPEHREIRDIKIDENIKFPVKDEYVCRMLQKYVSGEISGLDLSNWAAVIYMTPYFFPEGQTEEERWLASEGRMWVVLQKLVTPSIYGGISISVVQSYIDLLSCNP